MEAQSFWNQDSHRFRGNKCGKEHLYLYDPFYPLWIEHSGITHGPLLPLKKAKSMG